MEHHYVIPQNDQKSNWALPFFNIMMNSITNGPILALLQSIIPPDMQGRVFTVVGSLTGLASALGLAVAGPVADALGLGTWFILGGVACILMSTYAFMSPTVMSIERNHKQSEAKGALSPAPAEAPIGAD